jgi:3',5'-cyclic AMP phosphodiesterase CpdA
MAQRFAQLSDPHLSTLEGVSPTALLNKRALGYLSWRRKRRFEHRREVLDVLQDDLGAQPLDQILVTGDLTHIGLPEEFDQCRQWLEQLAPPDELALVPGNHDACVRAPWDDTFAKWAPYMAGDNAAATFPSLRVRDQIAFIGLSTGCPKPPLMASGTLGEAQLAALPALLKETAERGLFRVVYLHHSPIAGLEKWRKRLTDANRLQALLETHGAELVVHGHGHRAHFHTLQTRAGDLPVVAVPSASALGLHGGDVASYNTYSVARAANGWDLSIDTRRFDPDAGQFTMAGTRQVPLER